MQLCSIIYAHECSKSSKVTNRQRSTEFIFLKKTSIKITTNQPTFSHQNGFVLFKELQLVLLELIPCFVLTLLLVCRITGLTKELEQKEWKLCYNLRFYVCYYRWLQSTLVRCKDPVVLLNPMRGTTIELSDNSMATTSNIT